MADFAGANPQDVLLALQKQGADQSLMDQILPQDGGTTVPGAAQADPNSGWGSFSDFLANQGPLQTGPALPAPAANTVPGMDIPAGTYGPEAMMSSGGATGAWQDNPAATPPMGGQYTGDVVSVPQAEPQVTPAMGPPMMAPAAAAGVPGMPMQAQKAPDYGPLQQATQQLGQAQANTAASQAGAFDEGAALLKAGDERFQAQHAKTQEAYETARTHAAQDPMAEWSTGKRIMGAIAIGLGAFGAAMTHSPNYALDIINKQLDLEVGRRKDLVAHLKDQLGDERTARSMVREQLTNQVKMQVEALGLRGGSEEKKAAAQQLSDQLGVQAQQSKNEVIKSQQDTALKLAGLDVEQQKIGASLLMKQGELGQKAQERYVPGVGVMRTDDDAKQAKDFMRGKADAESAIDTLSRLRSKYPSGTLPVGPDAALASRAATKLMLAQKQGMQLGTLSESDIELLNKMAGGGGLSMWSRFDTVMAQLNAQRADWNKKADTWRGQALYSQGVQPQAPQNAAPSFKPVGAK